MEGWKKKEKEVIEKLLLLYVYVNFLDKNKH
jgi:hypothetical protein